MLRRGRESLPFGSGNDEAVIECRWHLPLGFLSLAKLANLIVLAPKLALFYINKMLPVAIWQPVNKLIAAKFSIWLQLEIKPTLSGITIWH